MRKTTFNSYFGSYFVLVAAFCSLSAFAEDWKGKADSSQLSVGGLTGVGFLDEHAGFAVLGTASKKILNQGFIPDINNQVSIEVEMGPLFMSGATPFAYSAHLRWDFVKDATWTFYAIGGLGGDISGDRFVMLPRFGAGTVWNFNSNFGIRAEVSHELIAAGVNLPLFY